MPLILPLLQEIFVQVMNACGSPSYFTSIHSACYTSVDLGPDTAVCSRTSVYLTINTLMLISLVDGFDDASFALTTPGEFFCQYHQ